MGACRRTPVPPVALHGEVVRARLLAGLARRFQLPLTVVDAGAGFGKSTLLAQAIRANQADPHGIDAWVACEPADCDDEHLAVAIVAALGRDVARGRPLAGVLDAIDSHAPIDVCIVLDDVHEVPPGSTSAVLLAELASDLPPHAHLVLAGRSAPPFDIGRQRAAGDVVDIGIDDLAFTATETSALAGLLGRPDSGAPDLGALAGWPSLLTLALSAPEGSAPQFLWEEIVEGLDADARRLLVALATLGRGSAADVAWLVSDGLEVGATDRGLAALVADVPLVRLDDDGWYAVHHLWEDAVERIFPETERAAVRRRALEMFERREDTLRTGWSAMRWGEDEALRRACRHLVRDTAGALPVDTARRWLAGAAVDRRQCPDLRLLDLAIRHAGDYVDPGLDVELDAIVDDLADAGDHNGIVVALILGMAIAHMRGDLDRMRALDARTRVLPTAEAVPLLRFLRQSVAAMTASLEGDPAAAVAAIESMTARDGPPRLTELIVRLHVNMLCLCGRADEAVAVAAPLLESASPYVRTLHAKTRWLAGDPGGFAGGRLDAAAPPGTNQRYHLFHAFYMIAVATSFGDGEAIAALGAVIDDSPKVDVRDDTMGDVVDAMRHIVAHDEGAAVRAIAAHVDAHGDDPVADGRLRRLLAVPYVCDERLRTRWRDIALGPSLARQRRIADDLLAARADALSPGHRFEAAGAVLTTLPLVWSVELAARAVAAGCGGGPALAEGLAELAPAAMRAELEHAAVNGDAALRDGAKILLDLLPDGTRPPVRIAVLGPLEVDTGEEGEVAGAELRRQRVRTLLEVLVLAGPLRRDRVAELMWPELDAIAAGRNLRVTLSRLRAVLEPGRRHTMARPILALERDHVAITRSPYVAVDLWQLRDDVAAADEVERGGDRTAAIAALERACGRWRGEPLVDLDPVDDALAGAVEEVRRLLADSALRLGELLLVAGRFDDAVVWAERVSRASPYEERAHRLAIAAHLHRRDRPALAQAVGVTQAMLDELGVDPEPATQMLLRQAADHIGPPSRATA
jgi:DNA-binding SARP family transcriptional activator